MNFVNIILKIKKDLMLPQVSVHHYSGASARAKRAQLSTVGNKIW